MQPVAGAPTYAAILFIYLIAMFGIGMVAQRAARTPVDFWVAGRRLGSGVLTGTFTATLISSVTTLGMAGNAYRFGENQWLTGIVLWLGLLVLLFTVHFFVRFRGYTVADVFAARYGPAVRWAAALVTVVGGLAYLGVQVCVMGQVLALVLGWPLTTAIVATSVVFIVYSVAGGWLAVAWTDCVQAVMIMAGLIWVTVAALGRVGGIAGLQTQLATVPHLDAWGSQSSPITAVTMAMALAIGVSAQPWHLTQAFAARDVTAMRSALSNGALLSAAAISFATLIGLAGRVLFGTEVAAADAILPYLTTQLLHPAVGGLIIAAIIAAIMSTADSLLLAVGTSVAHDVYQRVLAPRAGPAQLLAATRLSMVALGMLGVIVALWSPATVLAMGGYVFGGIGAAFFVPLYAGLVWRRGTATGALAAMVMGAAAVGLFAWRPVGIDPVVMGAAVSLLAYLAGSLLTSPQYERADPFLARIGRGRVHPEAAPPKAGLARRP